MNKIILLCGESGSGKTTIAKLLEKYYGLTSINSYTTRPKRQNNETGHIFLTEEEFGAIKVKDIVAYTEYNGYKYCATRQQVEENDIYVIDKNGIETFKECYKGTKTPIILYIKTKEEIRKQRMIDRGDSLEKTIERIENDRVAFQGIESVVNFTLNNNEEDLILLIRKIWLIYINN